MTIELLRPEMQVDFPRFSATEYERRYAAIRQAMAARNLDALIVWGESSGWGELSGARTGMASARYLSNFADQLTEYVLLTRDAAPTLFTFSRSHSTCARGLSVVPIEFAHLDIALAVAERIRAAQIQRGSIGLVGLSTILGQSLPSDQMDRLRAELPDAKLSVVTDLLETVRAVKADEELEWIGRAARHTDDAMAAVALVRPGLLEYALHADVGRAYLPQGGHLNFQALAATPMARPAFVSPGYHKSLRPFAAGDVILAEISAGYWGYGGYLARPVAIGAPAPGYRECFDIARRGLEAIESALAPGADLAQVGAAFNRALPPGWTNASPLVRGWGLAIEPPYLGSDGRAAAPQKLAERMVVAVSVNPVSPDGKIGLRVGELFRIGPTGVVRLQSTPREFRHV